MAKNRLSLSLKRPIPADSHRSCVTSVNNLDYHTFLKSDQPEEVILGVLGDFRGESPETVLHQIIQRVEETTAGDLALKRYFSQLRVLAQLRNLGNNLKDIAMDSIAKFVSVEKDAAYMVGFEKGKETFVIYLLKAGNQTPEQIADIAGVSVEFVKNVQQKLFKGK